MASLTLVTSLRSLIRDTAGVCTWVFSKNGNFAQRYFLIAFYQEPTLVKFKTKQKISN
jgi:hypothetical protein